MAPTDAPAVPPGLACVYADDDLLVFDKPSGLLCVPGRGADKQDCLSARAQQQWPDALIVHRLDQATSGLVLMARSLAVQRSLGHAFAERQVHKRYQAVVGGTLAPPQGSGWGVIDLPIAADWERRPLRVIDTERGKPSVTEWRVLAAEGHGGHGGESTRVELQPVTGRTHQLRVHLAALGHPILGDRLYADAAAQARAPRLLLHATRLALDHPRTGVPLQFHAPPPF